MNVEEMQAETETVMHSNRSKGWYVPKSLLILGGICISLLFILCLILTALYFSSNNDDLISTSSSSASGLTTSSSSNLTTNSSSSSSSSSNDGSCSSTSCNDISIEFDTSGSKKLRIYESPNEILPGIQFFTYSYNLLQGRPPMDLLLSGDYHQILSLTFDNDKISAGSEAYLVPDQLDLPAITAVCESQSKTTSLSSSTSSSSMYSQALEDTGSSSFDASVSASGWGFSVSASFGMALSHSHSSQSSNSLSHSQEGKSESSFTISKAKLYGATLRWQDDDLFSDSNDTSSYTSDFLTDVRKLKIALSSETMSNITKNIYLVEFIKEWGTHVLAKGVLGAQCRASTHFESHHSAQSLSKSADEAGSSSSEYSGSVSAGGSGFGFSASVSASYKYSSTSSYSTSATSDKEAAYSAEYSSDTTYCVGEVYITSTCGDMLGRQNEPSLVEHELLPIWDLNIFNNDDTYNCNIKTKLENMINNDIIGNGLSLCGDIGIPAANRTFWQSTNFHDFNGTNYEIFWDNSRCFDQYSMGLTLLKTGGNITTPFKQAYNFERREYTKISYQSSCESDGNSLNIGLTLNMIPYNKNFGIELSQQSDSSFLTYFYLGSGDTIDFGGASYITFCDEVSKYIYAGSYNIPDNCTDLCTEKLITIDIEESLTHECGDDYNVVSAYKGVSGSSTGQELYYESSMSNSTTMTFVESQWFSGVESFNAVDFTYIVFCDSDRIPSYGLINFAKDDFYLMSESEGYVAQKLVTFSNVNVNNNCNNVRVWTGLSARQTTCNIAFWTENENGYSFELNVALWDSGCNVASTSQQNYFSVKIQYMVLCAGGQ